MALLTGATLATEGSLFATGFGLDRILLVGGLGGGLLFTLLAARASRMARDIRRHLDEPPGKANDRPGKKQT